MGRSFGSGFASQRPLRAGVVTSGAPGFSGAAGGDCDLLLRIVAADLDDYRRFQVEHLTRIAGVQSVKTEIPMQKIKLTSELPL